MTRLVELEESGPRRLEPSDIDDEKGYRGLPVRIVGLVSVL